MLVGPHHPSLVRHSEASRANGPQEHSGKQPARHDAACAMLDGGGVFPPGATLSLPIALSANTSAMRQADVNADGASQSQFTHSESEYDELALQTWLGQH